MNIFITGGTGGLCHRLIPRLTGSGHNLETFENLYFPVTPAKAGVQNTLKTLDSGFRRNDDMDTETVFFKGLDSSYGF
jgi:nucleoside-diphosphate-sugar epimerase